jgi:HK97 gp10 family phage protein
MARRVVTSRGAQVQFEGLPELQAKMAELMSRATGKEVKKIWMQAALVLRDAARDYAPIAPGPVTHYEKGQPPRIIQPGALQAAIFAAYGKEDAPDVLVGVNDKQAPHAHWLEFGNARIPAQPYMRPALVLMRSTCVQIIADGYRRLLFEGGAIASPSAPEGEIDAPTVTEGRIRAVRERAKAAFSKRGQGISKGKFIK